MKIFNKGFTLIELLVVVAIIGVLATVVLSSLGQAREKAQIAKLKATLFQLRNGFELYHLDKGQYPMNGGYTGYSDICDGSSDIIHEIAPYINTEAFNLSKSLFNNPNSCLKYRPILSGSFCGNSPQNPGQIYEIQFITKGGFQIEPFWRTSYNGGSIEIHCMLPPR